MLSKKSIMPQLCILLLFSELYSTEIQIDVWPNLKHLDITFSINDNQRFNRITEQKKNADNMITRAIESADRNALGKAFNELFSATGAMFDLYDEYCIMAREKLPKSLPPEISRAVEFENFASENMNKSITLRKEAEIIDEVVKSSKLFGMAFDLEQLALITKGRALRIYQDFPVIYAYPWDNDITIMEGSPERSLRVFEIDIEQQEKIDSFTKDMDFHNGISFIIQIAAHNQEIPESQLKSIYSGDKKFKMMQEDGWYKYYFGPFGSYEEAERAMKTLNLRNVFIAAYLNGKRIGIDEAKKRQLSPN